VVLGLLLLALPHTSRATEPDTFTTNALRPVYTDLRTGVSRALPVSAIPENLIAALLAPNGHFIGSPMPRRPFGYDSLRASAGGASPLSVTAFGTPVHVSSATFPYSAAVFLKAYYPTCHGNTGSGVLIDPWHVLTCLHCVYQVDGSCTAELTNNVHLYAGYDDGNAPFGEATAVGVLWFSNYFTAGCSVIDEDCPNSYDIALVELSRPIGALAGWRGFGWTTCPSASTPFVIDGYDATQTDPGGLYEAAGTMEACGIVDPWLSSPSSIPGASGSGLSASDGDVYAVEYGNDAAGNRRAFCPITSSSFAIFGSQIASTTPTSPDLIPMAVTYATTSPDGTVQPGDILPSFAFTIFNNSSATFSGPLTFETYLSTDANSDAGDRLVRTQTFSPSLAPHVSFVANVTSNKIQIPADWSATSYFMKIRLVVADVNQQNNTTHGVEVATLARGRVRCSLGSRASLGITPQVAIDGVLGSDSTSALLLGGSTHLVYALSPAQVSDSVQLVCSQWSNRGPNPQSVVMLGDSTLVALFTPQYLVSTNASPGGSVQQRTAWADSGTTKTIAAVPDSGYNFGGWTGTGAGCYTGLANPATVTANGPIHETAVFTMATGVGYSSGVRQFGIQSSAPNPTHGSVYLDYGLRSSGPVSIIVYDVAGRSVRRLTRGWEPAGAHAVEWDGRDNQEGPAPAGIYLVVLRSAEGKSSKRVVLTR